MVFNVTFNNMSVISWRSVYWWRKPEFWWKPQTSQELLDMKTTT